MKCPDFLFVFSFVFFNRERGMGSNLFIWKRERRSVYEQKYGCSIFKRDKEGEKYGSYPSKYL